MIQVQQLSLPVTHTQKELEEKICKTLRIKREQIFDYRIARQSIDARKKKDIRYRYTIELDTASDQKIVNRLHHDTVRYLEKKRYSFSVTGTKRMRHRPVIVGSGPAGLFCAYLLAEHGYAPIVLERGRTVERRSMDVARFFQDGVLDETSNVQFGEGGAGTFSDGKLNTLVKDACGRSQKALSIFVAHGAPKEILYEAKPHIGTDRFTSILPSIRSKITAMGGSFLFESCMTDLNIQNGALRAVEINHKDWLDADVLIPAIGHSARDTFAMLHARNIPMEAKAFAVGLRIEHPQEMISQSQYGAMAVHLPPAPYKVTAKGTDGRGVYSFCMCPGGYVVNASSECERLAVNGMSFSSRDGVNANSAIIVSVTPEDFAQEGPLGGVAFQRELEERAYCLCDGAIPQQLYGDFKRKKPGAAYGAVASATCGRAQPGAVHRLLNDALYTSFCLGMEQFARKIPGFDREDAVLSGIESRTSSPIRIPRGADFQSEIKGVYPCGEGAGYAGGILSAAMDGMKAAEAIAAAYRPDRSIG